MHREKKMKLPLILTPYNIKKNNSKWTMDLHVKLSNHQEKKKKNRRKSFGSMAKQRVLILEVQRENLINGSFIENLNAFVL